MSLNSLQVCAYLSRPAARSTSAARRGMVVDASRRPLLGPPFWFLVITASRHAISVVSCGPASTDFGCRQQKHVSCMSFAVPHCRPGELERRYALCVTPPATSHCGEGQRGSPCRWPPAALLAVQPSFEPDSSRAFYAILGPVSAAVQAVQAPWRPSSPSGLLACRHPPTPPPTSRTTAAAESCHRSTPHAHPTPSRCPPAVLTLSVLLYHRFRSPDARGTRTRLSFSAKPPILPSPSHGSTHPPIHTQTPHPKHNRKPARHAGATRPPRYPSR